MVRIAACFVSSLVCRNERQKKRGEKTKKSIFCIIDLESKAVFVFCFVLYLFFVFDFCNSLLKSKTNFYHDD